MATGDISQFRDRYRDALEELIEAKAEDKVLPKSVEGGQQGYGKVMDLMAALNGSVKAAKERRSEGDGDAMVREMKVRTKAAKKATTTKGPARTAAARKRSAS
ncbi:hypothetical protein [Streptomyces sp. NPDC091416]|uniref:hypothetical protein n=1 Tax=Streptomyces sp. NPDC091416 TaxID=3366003 RepID=UPI00383039A4